MLAPLGSSAVLDSRFLLLGPNRKYLNSGVGSVDEWRASFFFDGGAGGPCADSRAPRLSCINMCYHDDASRLATLTVLQWSFEALSLLPKCIQAFQTSQYNNAKPEHKWKHSPAHKRCWEVSIPRSLGGSFRCRASSKALAQSRPVVGCPWDDWSVRWGASGFGIRQENIFSAATPASI